MVAIHVLFYRLLIFMKSHRTEKQKRRSLADDPVGFVLAMLAFILIPVYLHGLQPGFYTSDDLCGMFVYTTSAASWWLWIGKKTN